jgi:hypothetical protein
MQQAPYGAAPADGPYGGGGYGSEMGAQQGMVPAAGAPMGVPMAQAGYGGGVPMGAAGVGPKGQMRNPIMVFIISYVTCGLYGLWQTFQMCSELKAFLNTEEITPWWSFVFPLNLLLILKLPNLVTEAKRRAGHPNPSAGNIIMYLFFIWYIFPKDLNEVWNPTGQLQA